MSLLNYTIRRLLGIIPILFGVMLMSFALTRAMPGNPYKFLLQDVKITDSTYQTYLDNVERLGLDLPLLPQFYKYITNSLGVFWSFLIFTYMGFLILKTIYKLGKYVKTGLGESENNSSQIPVSIS